MMIRTGLSSSPVIGALLTVAGQGQAVAQEAVDAWSLDVRAGAVSQYRDRGSDLSGGEPALQGEAVLSLGSGFYGGVWASTIVEYGSGVDGEGAPVELTLSAGWAGSAAGFDLDLGVWSNHYPGGEDVAFLEFPIQAGRTLEPVDLSLGLVWAPAQTGTGDEADAWLWTRIEHAPQAWPVRLYATLGYEEGGFAPDGKTDWGLGLEVPAGPATLGLAWVDSDVEDGALVASVFWNFGSQADRPAPRPAPSASR